MIVELLVGISAAFIGTWLMVRILVRKAPEIGLVDRPNERSSHTRITPRGGGIGIVITWICGCLAWRIFAGLPGVSQLSFYTLIFCATVIAMMSLWDDFRSVGAGIRFLAHILCTVGCIVAFGWFTQIDVGLVVTVGLYGLLITAIWIVGLTNVFNFMDGIDGIAGLQAIVAALAWCIVGVSIGMSAVSVVSGILAGGCAGFLLHNWSPAKIFMGDVGSAFLGFVFGVLPLIALREWQGDSRAVGIARLPLFAVLVVWPFIADGAFTFCRRLLKGERVWKPHRTHLYQRMVQAGWAHSSVTLYYGIWAVFCSVAGYCYLFGIVGNWAWIGSGSTSLVTWAWTNYLERRNAVAT